MRQTGLTQSGTRGNVIGWISNTSIQYMDYIEIFNISLDLSTIYSPVLACV